MGRREELLELKESSSSFTKHLELCIVLLHELSRTLLASGESVSVLQKQRLDIFNHIGFLHSWV